MREPELVRTLPRAPLSLPAPVDRALATSEQVRIMGRRFDAQHPFFVVRKAGDTLEGIVIECLSSMKQEGQYTARQCQTLLSYARCRVNGTEIPREHWATVHPIPGSHIEIFRGVMGGGGGGKNPLGTILGVVAMVGSMIVAPWLGPTLGAAMGLTGSLAASIGGGLITMGFMGLAALGNLLFPSSMPSFSMPQIADAGKQSQTYSINGAQNQGNPYGYLPYVMGKHRLTPPLGAKSWTEWLGDEQYFHMLVVWGHPDMVVSDFRIEETPLEEYRDVEHHFHQSTTGDDLTLFAKSRNEMDVSAVVKNSDGWTTRVVGQAEDIVWDFAFQQGLARINTSNGNTESCTVQVEVQYREVGTETWYGVGARYDVVGATFTNIPYSYEERKRRRVESGDSYRYVYYYETVYYTVYFYIVDGSIQYNTTGFSGEPLWSVNHDQVTDHRISYSTGFNATYDASTHTMTIAAGEVTGNALLSWTEAKLDLVVKSARHEGLPRADYETRVRRISGDTNSQYIKDEVTWLKVRGVINRPAFSTPVPICVSELRIRATDQLSGYVSQFNALCSMNIPDYDPESGTWITRETHNPASIFRHLLTSGYSLRRPYTTAKLDAESVVAAWGWCNERGYTYDYVGDAEESVWNRLTSVLAAGRCALDYSDGRWGIVIDQPGKQPVQMFTPRNSWGIRVERSFYEAPHALLVKWIRAEDDYNETQNFVFADGYDKSTATNIVEWEYPGVTEWEQIYRAARYHLAKLLHRQVKITLSTDWEWLRVRRGELVGVASDVLMNTFGTARIDALLYRVTGPDGERQEILVYSEDDIPVDEQGQSLAPIGCQLDDSIVFSEPAPARYGIAIRDNSAKLSVYEIKAEYGEECSLLYFVNGLSVAQTPPLQALVSVSILGDEYAEYLVASIAPGENLSAELTLIPYSMDEIEASVSGPVPPWEPPIYLPDISGSGLSVPSILAVKSDESMLVRGQSGECIPRIGVWWYADVLLSGNLTVQASATPVDMSGQETGSAAISAPFVAIENVTERQAYDVRVRLVDPYTGRTGKWSSPVRHVVIGRTTPPPAPNMIYLEGYTLRIEQHVAPLDVVGHEIWMAFDEHDPFGYALKLSTPYVTDRKFDLSPYAGRARQVFVRTIDEIGLTSEPVRLVIDLGDAQPENVLFEISERDDNDWGGALVGGFVSSNALYSQTKTHLWQQELDEPLWQQSETAPLWASGVVEQLVYTWQIDAPKSLGGARVLVLPEIISGNLRALEMRVLKSPNLWPEDGLLLWQQDDGMPLWVQNIPSEWRAFSNDYVTPGGEILEFRLTMSPEVSAHIADILTILDVEDKEWSLEDVEVPLTGVYASIPEGYFRAITNVTFGMQYRDDLTAVVVRRVPENNPPVDDSGYLVRGPMIRAYTATNQPGTASVDIRMKGY